MVFGETPKRTRETRVLQHSFKKSIEQINGEQRHTCADHDLG